MAETPRVDIGASIQYGWKKFSENAGGLIVLMIAIGVVALVVGFILTALQAGADLRISSSGRISVRPSFIGMIWNVVLQALLTAVLVTLGSFLLRAVLGITRGVAVSAESATKTDNLVPYIITMVIISVVPAAIQSFLGWISGALSLLFVPIVFIWQIVVALAPLDVLDKGTEPMDAIKKSIEWVTGDIGGTGVAILIAYIVAGIGAILCGVGLLVSIPVGMIAVAYIYRARNNETVVA